MRSSSLPFRSHTHFEIDGEWNGSKGQPPMVTAYSANLEGLVVATLNDGESAEGEDGPNG